MKTIAITSGGFDPLHVGHAKYLREAEKFADYVLVIVNNDNWLKRKKGYSFLPERERVELLENLLPENYIVVLSEHKENTEDMSICEMLRILVRDLTGEVKLLLLNGGDRLESNIPEKQLCEELGIQMIFGVGGDKIQSSSDLVRKVCETIKSV